MGSVLGHVLHDPAKLLSKAQNKISDIVNTVKEKKGLKKGLEALVSNVLQQYMKQFCVPDWVHCTTRQQMADADNDQSGRTGTALFLFMSTRVTPCVIG